MPIDSSFVESITYEILSSSSLKQNRKCTSLRTHEQPLKSINLLKISYIRRSVSSAASHETDHLLARAGRRSAFACLHEFSGS